MPLYQYKCKECGKHYDDNRTVDTRDLSGKCPACGNEEGNGRVFPSTPPGASFKGRGFHCNDYPSRRF